MEYRGDIGRLLADAESRKGKEEGIEDAGMIECECCMQRRGESDEPKNQMGEER